jgi:hypothetical protein
MILRLALAASVLFAAGSAFAQTASPVTGNGNAAATTTMADLLAQGFEIKTAVPNGTIFVVFMQKDQSAYACEFVSLTETKCGAIN